MPPIADLLDGVWNVDGCYTNIGGETTRHMECLKIPEVVKCI